MTGSLVAAYVESVVNKDGGFGPSAFEPSAAETDRVGGLWLRSARLLWITVRVTCPAGWA